MKIEVIHHASIRLEDGIVIYFDPYDIHEERHDADVIFITHDHYDHYEKASIEKVRKASTKIILPKCLEEEEHDLCVEPNQEYEIEGLSFRTIPAYNMDKPFHPKEKGYVGYQLLLNGFYYYIMGDTNRTPEADEVKMDVCFVPIGGTYTMDVEEAAGYINFVKPKIAIPIHYGKIVGDLSLGEKLKQKVNENIEVQIKIKGE